MREQKGFIRPAARLFLLLAPLLWALWLVGRCGVDVPCTDQWAGECPLFVKMSLGTLGAGDFFAQHNEHRIFFPRLIFYGLGRLTRWNVRAELWVILGLAGIMAGNVWRTLRATGWRVAGVGFWLLLTADVLIFSPLHRENFLWGFQIGFLLPLACLTACPWVCCSPAVRTRFGGSFALCVVTTFSIGGGFVAWLLCFPLLWQTGGRDTWRAHRPWWVLWAAGFAGSVAGYLHGYAVPAGSANRWVFLQEPVLTTQYWLTYLGLPFAFGTPVDPLIVAQGSAAAMLLVLAGILFYLWRWRTDPVLWRRCLPWLAMAGIALAYAALTAVGRVQFGLRQALTSRYVIFAVLLPIGLSCLAATVDRHLRRQARAESFPARAVRTVLIGLGSGLALLHGLGAFLVAPGWEEYSHSLLKSKALVETVNVVDEPELLTRYVDLTPLREKIERLDQIGYLRPPLVRSRLVAEIADGSALAAESGSLERVIRGPDGRLGMRGWAVVPGKARPADAVLLTSDNAQGQAVLFAVAETGTAHPGANLPPRPATCAQSGWQKIFPADRLPAGSGTLKAWSFDAETGRAYRLSGQAAVPP